MRSPKDFFAPLAVGAPEPRREIPFPPSRMIHFFPPHLEKVTAKLPEIAPTVDILLGNLEDAQAALAAYKESHRDEFGDPVPLTWIEQSVRTLTLIHSSGG